MLRNCEINVIRFEERFVRGTLDEIWLPEIRGLNWVLLTRDDRWRYNASEMRAIIRTKGKAFVFVPRKLKEEEIAAIIWRAYPKMAEIVAKVPPPFIYRILADAAVTPTYPRP